MLQSMVSQRVRHDYVAELTEFAQRILDFPIGAILPLVHCKAERSHGLKKIPNMENLKQTYYIF